MRLKASSLTSGRTSLIIAVDKFSGCKSYDIILKHIAVISGIFCDFIKEIISKMWCGEQAKSDSCLITNQHRAHTFITKFTIVINSIDGMEVDTYKRRIRLAHVNQPSLPGRGDLLESRASTLPHFMTRITHHVDTSGQN